MRTKAEIVSAAFQGGIELTIEECAQAFGCHVEGDPLSTTNALKNELERTGLSLTGSGDYESKRVVRSGQNYNLDDEIEGHERSRLELKETLFLDVRQHENRPGTPVAELSQEVPIKAALKTICGFLNGKGGVLLIGVSDSKEKRGIERDFGCLGIAGDADLWQRRFTELVKTRFKDGRQIISYLDIELVSTAGITIARVEVTKRDQESFVKEADGKYHYYQRAGSETNEYEIQELPEIIRQRFELAKSQGG